MLSTIEYPVGPEIDVWDLDNTIYDGPSTNHFVEELIRLGALKNCVEVRTELDQLHEAGDSLNLVRSINRAVYDMVYRPESPVLEAAIDQAAELTVDRVFETVYEEMKGPLEESKERGFALITEGPHPVAVALARRMNSVIADGRKPEEYRTLRSVPHGEKLPGFNKLKRLESVLALRGLVLSRDIHIRKVYGDSSTDLPLLEAAAQTNPDHAFVVNPMTAKMAERAAEANWPEPIRCKIRQPFGDFSRWPALPRA